MESVEKYDPVVLKRKIDQIKQIKQENLAH